MLETLLSGAVTGLLGSAVNGYFSYKNKKLDIELNNSKYAHETRMVELKANAAIEIEDSKAFKEAVSSEPKKYYEGTEYSPFQRWLMIGLDFVRGAVRPVLTLYLCILTTVIYIKAERVMSIDLLLPSMAYDLVNQIINTVLYLTVTCVCYWFGSRGNKAPNSSNLAARFISTLYSSQITSTAAENQPTGQLTSPSVHSFPSAVSPCY
jgi:hypothetical protein